MSKKLGVKTSDNVVLVVNEHVVLAPEETVDVSLVYRVDGILHLLGVETIRPSQTLRDARSTADARFGLPSNVSFRFIKVTESGETDISVLDEGKIALQDVFRETELPHGAKMSNIVLVRFPDGAPPIQRVPLCTLTDNGPNTVESSVLMHSNSALSPCAAPSPRLHRAKSFPVHRALGNVSSFVLTTVFTVEAARADEFHKLAGELNNAISRENSNVEVHTHANADVPREGVARQILRIEIWPSIESYEESLAQLTTIRLALADRSSKQDIFTPYSPRIARSPLKRAPVASPNAGAKEGDAVSKSPTAPAQQHVMGLGLVTGAPKEECA